MACSWEVFVKDGLICWELQKTDYPQIDPDIPNVEPRGCQRGVTASWYPYSPLRPKFPYVRKVLWDYYAEELANGKDPVDAYASVVEDPEKSKQYKAARGKAGWKRVSWDEATEMVAAGQIHTIKKYGPAATISVASSQLTLFQPALPLAALYCFDFSGSSTTLA
jgi:nitrate reductase alpha subunit